MSEREARPANIGDEIPEGYAVMGIFPCGCVCSADSRPTPKSIKEAQVGNLRAEFVPMPEAERRFKESWGHRDGCPEASRV